MSHKLTLDTLFSGTSQAASFSSEVVNFSYLNQGSFQVVITTAGGVTWTAAVQGSNDGVTFIDTATPTAVTGSTNLMLSIADLTSVYYRVNFVRTAGTLSTVSVIAAGKG
jgi:hypothetical protein